MCCDNLWYISMYNYSELSKDKEMSRVVVGCGSKVL